MGECMKDVYPDLLLIGGLRSAYQSISTYHAYPSYFRTFFTTYIDQIDLAY